MHKTNKWLEEIFLKFTEKSEKAGLSNTRGKNAEQQQEKNKKKHLGGGVQQQAKLQNFNILVQQCHLKKVY